ncbi:MAG: HNH endonuclease signature motif containing protein [Marmoricola sp.]
MTISYLSQPLARRTRRRNRCAEANPEAGAVLASVRRTQDEVRSGEAQVLAQAVEWARLHEVDVDSSDAATWDGAPVPLAGDGAPAIAEFSIPEFTAALGMKPQAGRFFIAHALELAHRLPLTYAQVLAGVVPVWRARRIAEQTLHLSAEAAAYVDAEVAPVAHKIGPVVAERLVDEAVARFMPEHAARMAAQAAEQRHVTVDKRTIGFQGTGRIYGELDLADALDLDEALARGAEYLKEQGSTDSLDVRRAQALGQLARGEQQRSETVIYVHHKPEDSHATLKNAGTHLVTLEQVKQWCEDSQKVTIKPVIDLAEVIVCDRYEPSDRLREQIVLRDRTCVHPYCDRPARSADLDHIVEYPDGETTSSNLAPLCRFHHRLKTHGGWSYVMIRPGAYLWRSPYGYEYVRDETGTRDITPRPVDPPGA